MTAPDLHFLVIGVVLVVAAILLLLIFPALEHYRWSRRNGRRGSGYMR